MVSNESCELFTCDDFLNLVVQGEYIDDDLYSEALCHLCYGNKKVSKATIKCILKQIDKVGDFSNVNGYLDVVDRLCQIRDFDSKSGKSLQKLRLESIFGYP